MTQKPVHTILSHDNNNDNTLPKGAKRKLIVNKF